MSVATHLQATATAVSPSDPDIGSITRSTDTLRQRLKDHFGSDIKEQVQFGSSTRGTMLSRKADAESDVDYMVVFDNSGDLKPQTFIDRLARFAKARYASSEIKQSHPTVVLRLNHIKFDLVPAYRSWGTLHIPAPAKSFLEWMSTDPNGFNSQLTDKNKAESYHIKPLIRLLKYWNARSGYIYDSYSFEQWVVGRWFLTASTLKDYFYSSVESLPEGWDYAKWRLDKIQRAKEIVSNTKKYEADSMPATAEAEIKKMIPVV